jgi:hypothetical protein
MHITFLIYRGNIWVEKIEEIKNETCSAEFSNGRKYIKMLN